MDTFITNNSHGRILVVDDFDALFEPFVQLSAGLKSHQGTGLGLSISKKYIQLMDGKIGVQSKPGVGSLFWFTICVKIANSKEIEQTECFKISIESDQIHNNVKNSDSDNQPCNILTSERMAALQMDLIENLKQASLNYNIKRIYDIIILLWQIMKHRILGRGLPH